MLCDDAILGMKDERNWSRGGNVVVVIASRRVGILPWLWSWLASFLVQGPEAGPFSCCSSRD